MLPMASSGTHRVHSLATGPHPLPMERINALEICLSVSQGVSGSGKRSTTGSYVIWGLRDWTWGFDRKHQAGWPQKTPRGCPGPTINLDSQTRLSYLC